MINKAYKGTGFTFKLASVSRTSNAHWFNNALPEVDFPMQNSLRRGSGSDLNVYSIGCVVFHWRRRRKLGIAS